MSKSDRKNNSSFEDRSPNKREGIKKPRYDKNSRNTSIDANDKALELDIDDNVNMSSTPAFDETIRPDYSSSPIKKRTQFISAQKGNRYNNFSVAPFSVHIESIESDIDSTSGGNIGNLHPMSIGKALCGKFLNIAVIRKLGRNIICVDFNNFMDANRMVMSRGILPPLWVAYIPNYKVYRSGVIRDVNPSLSEKEILENLSFFGDSISVHSVERMKFRGKRDNNLKDSFSVKITFVANLLPESILCYKVKCKVFPFINKVRRCTNCSRWGHSSAFCRSQVTCGHCGEGHSSDECDKSNLNQSCINCKGDHFSFDTSCPIYMKFKLINTVMALVNVSQFRAKNLILSKKITSCKQAEKLFRSSAFGGWNFETLGVGAGSEAGSVGTPFCLPRDGFPALKRVRNGTRNSGSDTDSSHRHDETLRTPNQQGALEVREVSDPSRDVDSRAKKFPCPGVILHDLKSFYCFNLNNKDKYMAVMDYLRLLFKEESMYMN